MSDTREFVETLGQKAANALEYAIKRDLPQLLAEMRREQWMAKEANDEEAVKDAKSKTVSIQLSLYAPSETYAIVRVAHLSWSQRRRFKDTDFPEEEIDLEQPNLPGLLDEEEPPASPAPSRTGEESAHFGPECADLQSIHNLITAARQIGADIVMPCDWKDQPNADKGLIRYSIKDAEWTFHLVPDGMMAGVLNAAEDHGDIVYWPQSDGSMRMTIDTRDRLGEAGFKVGAYPSDTFLADGGILICYTPCDARP